jgi:hypothetical protein
MLDCSLLAVYSAKPKSALYDAVTFDVLARTCAQTEGNDRISHYSGYERTRDIDIVKHKRCPRTIKLDLQCAPEVYEE